ncbi:MFS transporter [Actinoallomurus sp. NPDC052308]|uniref:MFS transporter n=1 Tax=Actinoallomurus sp. NPDC052308 TaxID=3155530 RepID=UPI003432C693
MVDVAVSSRESGEQTHTGLTLLALATAGMVASVQQTLVLPLLPALMRHFDASVSAVTWVFTASLLAGAVATPLLSRLGDMYGKKNLIIIAMGLLVVGSTICALSNSLGVLIVGRALQGTSSALIPLAIGMIRDTFPREKVTSGIGIVSATMGVGGSIGMIVTGLIADHTSSYRPEFWIATGAAGVGLVLVALSARDVGVRVGGRPDIPGAVFLAGLLVCLLLAISEGNDWGWSSAGVLGLFGATVVLAAVWVVIELRVDQPLVRLNLLVGRQSLSANAASLLLGFAMFAAFTLISNFVQTPKAIGYGLGGSVLDVGLYMLPSTFTMFVCSALSGRIAGRIGAAYTLAIGSVGAGLSYLWLAVSHGHGFDMLGFSAVQGIGVGVAYAALGTLAVQHVPMDQSGIASGINSLVRTAGGSVSGAVTAAVLTGQTIPGTPGVPTEHAYVVCFVIATIGAVLAAVVAVVHGVRHKSVPHGVEALEIS